MAESTASHDFLEHLAARDFAGLASTLSPDVQVRLLLPRGLEEYSDRDAVVRRIEGWFGTASVFDLDSSTAEPIGSRQRLSWRFRVVRDGHTQEVVEQVAFLTLGSGGIDRMDLLCSGFQTELSPEACAVQAFEAGTMGCSDGLAQEFRRRIDGVPVGGSLAVIVRDPAAKEDLPSLARLLGQSVKSTKAHEDERLTITVERTK